MGLLAWRSLKSGRMGTESMGLKFRREFEARFYGVVNKQVGIRAKRVKDVV